MPELLLPTHLNTRIPRVLRTEFASPEGVVVCIDTTTSNGTHDIAIIDNGLRISQPNQGRYPFTERVRATEWFRTVEQLGQVAVGDRF
jgi:hypothetical protein